MTTAFNTITDAFVAKLQAATAVCPNISADGDAEPLPAGQSQSILVLLSSAEPQQMAGILGNPVDWVTTVRVMCFAAVAGASARTTANNLANAAYTRLATDPSLGISGVFIGEPRISFETDQAANRQAIATLEYSVQHRTINSTLD